MVLNQIEDLPSDYYAYRKEALLWSQKLSGKLWTDYNPHDPGITIIETLCYVLTELDYKLGFTIEDLLHSSVESKEFNLADNALYKAEDIFSTSPVTANDFRILLIDQIDGIANAWLLLVEDSTDTFDLILQLNSKSNGESIISLVHSLFQEYKVFGWRLNSIRIIEKKDLILNGDFYFESDQSAEKLLATLLYEFNERVVNTQPSRYTTEQLLSKDNKLNEVFSGPRVTNGFILEEELQPFSDVIHLQAVKGILNEIEGVLALKNLALLDGSEVYTKLISTKEYMPFINPKKEQQIRIFNDGKPIEINVEEVDYQYNKIDQAARRNYLLSNEKASSFDFSANTKNRNIAVYYKMLQEFPTIYKIKSSQLHEGQSKDNEQFEKLLLPFDQFIANAMKQLAEVSTFFSVKNNDLLYNQQALKSGGVSLSKKAESKIDFLKKRNETLNHLLDRFDINFDRNLPDIFYGNYPKSLAQRIKCKELMLKYLPSVGAYRGTLKKMDNTDLTYLSFELLLKLWIDISPQKPLTKAVNEWNVNISNLENDGEIKVDDHINDLFETNALEDIRKLYLYTDEPLESLLTDGLKKGNYSISKTIEEGHYGLFLSLGEKRTKNLIRKSRKKALLVNTINEWRKRILEINKRSEGFYLLDNSLLQDSILFESQTISFVFSAWSIRFQLRNFQQNVEEIFIQHLPAHLKINFIWLKYDEMKAFETDYLDEELNERPQQKNLFSAQVELLLASKLGKEINGE